MYEDNDLYNLNFDDEQTEQSEQTEQKSEPESQPAEPKTEPKNEPNIQPQPLNQLNDEQIAFVERARQKDELERVVNDIKTRVPDFDMEVVSKALLAMSPDEVKRYYNPQGLEILWYERFANNAPVNNPAIDTSRSANSGVSMDDLAKKIAAGTASMAEEQEFYVRLGRIGQSDY